LNRILGLELQTSRVKFCFDNLGLNLSNNLLAKDIDVHKTTNKPLSELSADKLAQLNDMYNSLPGSDNDATKQSSEQTKFKNYLTDYDVASALVSNSRLRISESALNATTVVADTLIHYLCRHIVARAVKTGKKNVVVKSALVGLECIPLFELFRNSDTYKNATTSVQSDKPCCEADACDMDEVSAEPVELDDENSNELYESSEPKQKSDFSYYVPRIIKYYCHSEESANLRIAKAVKDFVSDLVREFVKCKLTQYVKIIMNLKKAKTVKDEVILNAVHLMLLNACPLHNEYMKVLSLRYMQSMQRSNLYDEQKAKFGSFEEAKLVSPEMTESEYNVSLHVLDTFIDNLPNTVECLSSLQDLPFTEPEEPKKVKKPRVPRQTKQLNSVLPSEPVVLDVLVISSDPAPVELVEPVSSDSAPAVKEVASKKKRQPKAKNVQLEQPSETLTMPTSVPSVPLAVVEPVPSVETFEPVKPKAKRQPKAKPAQ
jgi:hypothetical protein